MGYSDMVEAIEEVMEELGADSPEEFGEMCDSMTEDEFAVFWGGFQDAVGVDPEELGDFAAAMMEVAGIDEDDFDDEDDADEDEVD